MRNVIKLTGLAVLGAIVACGSTTVVQQPPKDPTPAPTAAPTTPPVATPSTPPADTTAAPPATTTAPPATTSAPPTVAPWQEPPEPKDPPKDHKWAFADGRPAGLKSGAPMAYWLWNGGAADHWWHVRTTTATMKHRFQGWIVGEGKDPIREFKTTKTEHGDRVRVTPKGIAFDFTTDGHEDGFDFKVAGRHCVRFHLFIDGDAKPAHVNIGKNDAHPAHAHFRLCP